MNYKKVLKISRPRFWVYEFGTFWGLGIFAGLSSIYIMPQNLWLILIFAFYFLIPANILIYGVNDIYDYETDKLNPKKLEYEALVTPKEQKKLWKWILTTNLPFLFFIPFLNFYSKITFILFLFFAFFYSAYPIRAKIKPFLDSFFSAGHYVATGLFGYYLAGGSGIPYLVILFSMCWAISMHAYSAIPDIKADGDAGLDTIATFLGKTKTLHLCLFLFLSTSIFISFYNVYLGVIAFFSYGLIILKSYKANDKELFDLYKIYPKLNLILGFLIFITIILNKI